LKSIPLAAEGDVLIVESTLAACAAALGLARSGRKVILASSSASLGHEVAVCLRPWIASQELEKAPVLFRPWLRACALPGGLLSLAKFTEGLEDLLLSAGVRFYYGLAPAGVLRASGGGLGGLVFAGKAGLVGIRARLSVDASPHATSARLAGAAFLPRLENPSQRMISYSMQALPGAGAFPAVALPLGGGDELRFHGSYAEFRLRPGLDPALPFYESRLAAAARMAALAGAARLKKSGALPAGARFLRGGDALHFEPCLGLDPAAKLPRGLAVLGICAPLGRAEAAALHENPLLGLALGLKQAQGLGQPGPSRGPWRADFKMPGAAGKPQKFRFNDAQGLVYGLTASAGAGQASAPLSGRCQVLVVGGGTSGLPAGISAARLGADTVVVEKHSDLGGTRTLGGVADYWFGRRSAYVREIDRDNLAREAGMPMSAHYLSLLRGAGARALLGCQAAGVMVERGRAAGVVFAGANGLEAMRAGRVIDATGDGDLAAWAGQPYAWGSGRDAMTMWFSFGKFTGARASASRQYDSVVDLRDPADLTRAMLTARRRVGVFGLGDTPQFYLAPRESRHIAGKARMDYAGILRGAKPKDLALVCRSNFDIKGVASSDWVLGGYVEKNYTRNYDAPVPLGALLPKKLEGMLVVGKAYDISHDALSLARMERDMMAMGGAAALAAWISIRHKKPLSKLPLPEFQRGLLKLGILEKGDLRGLGKKAKPSRSQELGLASRLAAGKAGLAEQVRLLSRGRAVLPLLRRLFKRQPGSTELARALCFLGDPLGLPAAIRELERLCAQGLPMLPFHHHAPPDHGWSPEPCYWIAAASRVRSPALVPALASIAARLRVDPKTCDSSFDYVFALSYAAERLAAPGSIPFLRRLARLKALRNRQLPLGADWRRGVDWVAERHAYLELCLGRAMARCGSAEGYAVLKRYTRDQRGFLARSAKDELFDLSKIPGRGPKPYLKEIG
jgi:hypothetical protein